MEEWKVVPGFPRYLVSNHGRVQGPRKMRKLELNTDGYYRVVLCGPRRRQRYKVHRLVATLFVPGYKGGLIVDHIDRKKFNNHYTNLRWVTYTENNRNNGRGTLLGTSFEKDTKKWKAYTQYEGKSLNLGRFKKQEDARRRYANALALIDLGDPIKAR